MDIAAPDDITGWPALDRTPKLFIGGKQARPDSGYSRPVLGPHGDYLGEVGEGNRKDIRNAVEAAHAASGWASATGHLRAQILYYLAENLSTRADEFAATHRQHDRLRARMRRRARWRRASSGSSPMAPGPTSTTARFTRRRCAA